MKKIALLLVLLNASVCLAQKTAPTIVTGRVLSLQDSLKVKEWFFAALSAKTINNYDQSTEYFNKILDVDPANDAALYELGYISHRSGKEQDAENLARKAVTVKPENEWYWLLLADVYKKTSNLPQLTLVFDELIRISPDKEDYYFDKANALFLQTQYDEALETYAAIEKRFGLSEDLISMRQRVYQKQGKSDKAAGELQKLAESNPNDVRSLVELSQVYLKAGNNAKALETLLKAKTADPSNAYVQLSLADLYRGQGKNDEAFVELKSAFGSTEMDVDSKLRIILSFFPQFAAEKVRNEAEELAMIMTKAHPAEPKAWSVYGDVLFQQQKYPEARTSYRKALELNSQVYMIWEQLVRIDVTEGDYDAAIKEGEEALSIFPNQANLFLLTGTAYAQKQDHEKAVSYLKNAVSLQIDDKESLAQTYSILADSYNSLKRYKESDLAYDESLKLEPDNTFTLNNYAYYLSLRSERLDKAEQMSRRANELDKGNPSYEDTHAWVLFREKKYKEARTWIEKAIADDKTGNGTLFEHYGDILFMLNQNELAVTQWTIARDKGVVSETLNKKINEKKYLE
ncbi:MAG: hypothetical protein K0S09_2763 [Sphingobacteriaceae bacterium]|jgi:tetratricopeptide (TPR) repeat protein|nr:hypothetical protein [Sphingobacteriaceae bacterium]